MIPKQKKKTINNKQLLSILIPSVSIYFKGIPTKQPHTQLGFKLMNGQFFGTLDKLIPQLNNNNLYSFPLSQCNNMGIVK